MKIKCWEIEPYHNNQADSCVIQILGEESHRKALDYAIARLKEQWDETAYDESKEPKVTMRIITMCKSELKEIEDY